MQKSSIAVLMATYNGLEWISEQIHTIQSQVGVNVSLYLSDDQSIDGTQEFIANLQSSEIDIILLPPGGKFGSAGANFLRLLRDVDVSKYNYVAFSDQDDIWHENKLSAAVNVIETKVVDGYSGNVTAFWPDGTRKIICKSQPQQEYDYMFESAGPGCSFVITRKLAVALQKFILSNQDDCKDVALHDWFVYAYARSRKCKWFIDAEPYVLYRQHEENVVGANVGFRAKVDRWRKMRKGWHRSQALLLGRMLDYEDTFPMTELKRYHFSDRLNLIVHARKLRRNFRDCLALILFFITTAKK